MLVANYGGLGIAQTTGATVTIDATVSRITLPIVGGYHGAARSRGFTPDVGAPVLSGVPADITVAAQDAGGAVVGYALPTAADDESPDPVVACDPPPGSKFPVGATVVTCSARDDYDNTAQSAFTVTVSGPGAPPPPEPQPGTPQVPPDGDTRADTAAPRLGRPRLRLRGRTARIRIRLSEPARVRLVLRRKGVRRALRIVTVPVRAGEHTVRLKLGRLDAGRRYAITVRARDAAGNRSRSARLTFRR